MRILLTHRYYWPDTSSPYAFMLRSLAEHLVSCGHDVSVFTALPDETRLETIKKAPDAAGIRVVRRKLPPEDRARPVARAATAGRYAAAVFFHVLRSPAELVMAASFPPVIAAWAAGLACRLSGKKFIYHVQDVHPEAAWLARPGKRRGFAFKILQHLDNQSLRRASRIVVLSDDMARTLSDRAGHVLPLEVINNFALEGFGAGSEPPAGFRKLPNRKRLIFAGNLGSFQNLPMLTEGVARALAKHKDAELVFLGRGAALDGLKRQWHRHEQITFLPHLPPAQARTLIGEADIGLLSLNPGVFRLSFPSKLLTYLQLGVPVMAAIERESALSQLIEQNGLGRVAAASDPENIASCIHQLLERPLHRSSIKNWHDRNVAPEVAMARWKKLFDEAGEQAKHEVGLVPGNDPD